MSVEVRAAGDRFLTRSPGVQTRHAFSFGPHWDAANTGFGALVLHDEHRLDPGAGFPPHRHRGVDVVTWVADGELVHEDDAGRRAVVPAGTAAHLRAGVGVVHAEHAGAAGARFVQAWVTGDAAAASSYDVHPVEGDGLAVAVALPAAVLHVGRLPAGGGVALPTARRVHVAVVRGEVALRTGAGDHRLAEGDAARLRGTAGRLDSAGGAELLVWALTEE